MIQLVGPSFFLSAAATLPQGSLHEQACNHGNRGRQITRCHTQNNNNTISPDFLCLKTRLLTSSNKDKARHWN